MTCREVSSLKETETLARQMAAYLKAGDVVCLTGDLGAGKTTFTQVLCKALGVEEPVTSPTFSLIQEYQGSLPVYHFDAYRMNRPAELVELGGEEYLYGTGVCVIEWADRVREYMPENSLWIRIQWAGQNQRRFCLESGGKSCPRLKELFIS